ncbi:c-type cytochrome [Novosphingobium sp. PhB165]|uniref:c-type cytochrome n=1 Tax=Novosphingobium sp. PhB165 TaxID=2485105 RepID=UPI001FB1D7EF|nr:c-type cytochrome [Novosphingobium sp. PhB165]
MQRPLIRLASIVLLALGLGGCGDDHREERLRAAGPHPSLDALMKVADADVGARKFRQCAACHSIIEGASDRGGPNLYGVFGKPIASNSPRYGYTAALSSHGGTWDERTLNAWIANPMKMVPGTTMQFAGVEDPLTRADLIAYLRSQTPGK